VEHFIVMENLFHARPGISHRFDLKGARGKQRRVKTTEDKMQTTAATAAGGDAIDAHAVAEAPEAAMLAMSGSSSSDGGGEKRVFGSFREADAAAAAATARDAAAAAERGGGDGSDATAAADAHVATESGDTAGAAATAALSPAPPPAAMEPEEDVVAAVLQDVNFMEFLRGFPLPLSSEGKIRMIDAVRRDTNFLARGRIMDYSFLIGIDVERHELVVGIIDFLRRCVAVLLVRSPRRFFATSVPSSRALATDCD
jgi:hypothetical protein